MSLLDDELKNALRRQQPSPGFADRVLAAVPGPRRTAIPRWFAAAAVLALVSGGVEYQHQRRLRQGEQAKQQVMLALRITGSKLKFVKEKIHAIDSPRR